MAWACAPPVSYIMHCSIACDYTTQLRSRCAGAAALPRRSYTWGDEVGSLPLHDLLSEFCGTTDTTPGLTLAGACLILLLTMELETCANTGYGVEHGSWTTGACRQPGPQSRCEEISHGLAAQSCAS